jgi:hypothetical protein
MLYSENYYQSLLYLTYSVSMADGESHSKEEEGIKKIIDKEQVPAGLVQPFKKSKEEYSLSEIFKIGIEHVKNCESDEQYRALAWVYKIIEVDGLVHLKEAKWLLQAIAATGLELDYMIQESRRLPDI